MKKYLVCILIISMFILCSCKTNISTSSDNQQISEISTVEIKLNDDENKSTVDEIKDDTQNQKTVINVDFQSAKMSFVGSNDNVSTVEKEYSFDKVSKFEAYTKNNIESKNLNLFGVEHKSVPYYQSERNQYTGEDYDTFKNSDIEVDISSTGGIISCKAEKPIKVFDNENKHSENLAKKFLKGIAPDYKYDTVQVYEIDVADRYIYTFFKSINGIRTSDSIGIALNSKGEFRWYHINNVGKYENIEIKNFNIDDFLQRVDKYVEDAFGDVLVDYRIFEEGPRFNIFTGDKVELTIPIVIDVKDTDGVEYSITEDVVFELN